VRLFQQKAKTNIKRCDMNFIRCWTPQQGKHCIAVWNSPFVSFSTSWKGNLCNSVAFLNVQMRPKPFKCTVARLIERDYNSHKSWSSHCDCNATCVVWVRAMNRNTHSRISLRDCRPVHDNFTRRAKSLKGRNADQSNRTNNAFNKLRCLIIVR